ncbi:type VI secretion system tube protein TssD [Taibaiella helva]|uniref:type VI secretion system tube protein TssD n=1 Tax=Taibaiella helva TaxID=2301235 RepID=UPI000E59787B|nr:type VI secretion system tube protein TssD [Taibaiella helva]
MSFKAKMIIGENEYNILNFEYEMSQSIDRNGVPRANVIGNLMILTLEATARNSEITEWATDNNMKKNGRIEFYRRDGDAAGKKINFNDAYLIYHKDIFDAAGPVPMKTILHISGMRVTVDDSYSITSSGFDWKKAGVAFAKAAGSAALGFAAGAAKTGAADALGKDSSENKYAGEGIEGANKLGDGAISSFIPD